MIIKNYELEKLNIDKNKNFLFYGENQGYKNQIIENKFKKHYKESTFYYEESEVLSNKENFFNNILCPITYWKAFFV